MAGPFETEALRSTLSLRLGDAPPGSVQTPIVPLAASLRQKGLRLELVTLDPSIDKIQKFDEDGVLVTYVPMRGAPRHRARVRSLDFFAKEIAGLSLIMRESSADIIHAHWTYEYAEAAVRTPRPHLVTMHDSGWHVLWFFRNFYRLIRLMMMLRVMPRAQRMTAVSPYIASLARFHGHFRNVAVIPNGVHLPGKVPIPRGWPAENPVLVAVGDQGRLKNIQAALEAFKEIRCSMQGAELHLFGPQLDSERLGRLPGVIGHGAVSHDRLMQFLSERASLLIHPSLEETFGVIIAEAKARGIPCVAGERSGGVPFTCGVDGGCELVDVRSPGAISRATIEILMDRKRYEKMSRAARLDAESRFDIVKATDQYIALYHRILTDYR